MIYSVLLAKFELQQLRLMIMRRRPVSDYFVDVYNLIDIFGGVAAVATLVQMAANYTHSDVVQSLAVLLRGAKGVYFLRGNPSTAPLINMLQQIVRNMGSFLKVLVIVLLT